jgi:acyl-CoA thioester hydrolase
LTISLFEFGQNIGFGLVCTHGSPTGFNSENQGEIDNMNRASTEEFVTPVTVEFEDVDSYGIAHHTKLVAYLERARVRFLAGLGFDLSMGETHMVLYHLDMRFKQAVQLLDELEVTVSTKSVDDYQLVLGYKIYKDNVLVARAFTTLAFVSNATKKVIPIPSEYAAVLKAGL